MKASHPAIGGQVEIGTTQTTDGATIDKVLDNTPAKDAGLEDGDQVTDASP